MIFFHDKHWYRSEPLFSVEEEEGDDDSDDDDDDRIDVQKPPSLTPSQETITLAPMEMRPRKTEYEFLLFNYLLRFVHREGQIGDFARAGLLFLMDVAMSPGDSVHLLMGEESPSVPPGSDPVTDAALALAEYILDGDFSEVLGAGLGAVYSLLPSKLEFHPHTSAEAGHMVIGSTGEESEDEKEMLEVARARSRALGVEDASNPDFKSRLDHFLKLLEFIQDVLRRNGSHDAIDASSLVGTAIVNSILDAVRRIFFENVLYPSVLECSDVDGSAVAVMSYIEVMIRTLHEGPLSELLVSFLFSEDNDEVRVRPRAHAMLTLNSETVPPLAIESEKDKKLRRRKSSAMVLLEMEAPDAKKPSEYFTSMGRFTLKDLLLTNLKSMSRPTAISALQLLQTIILQHPQMSIDNLMLVVPDAEATSFPYPALNPAAKQPLSFSSFDVEDDDETFVYPGADPGVPKMSSAPVFIQPLTTYSTHEREMGLYLKLVSRVDPSHNGDPFSTGYDHYLRDAIFSIQNQPAFRIDPEDSDLELRKKVKHRLNVNDPILALVLESLRKFFSNSPEYNVALTGVLATLAIHPDRSLAGWLTFAPAESPFDRPEDEEHETHLSNDGDDRSIDFEIDEKLATDSNVLPASSMDERTRPIIHTIYHGLVGQLERYRQMLDNFDKFLLERRQGLVFSENLSDALSLGWELTDELPKPFGIESIQQTIQRPILSASNSLVSFLTPKKSKSRPSAPSTPTKAGDMKNVTSSPFAPHYQKTNSIVVEPFVVPSPVSGIWTPSQPEKWNVEEEDVFTSGWGEKAKKETKDDTLFDKPAHITLSQLLDNVVVLEESIKELVAIIHARRSLGIDSIRYL